MCLLCRVSRLHELLLDYGALRFSADGQVYAFGRNWFEPLGAGANQAETLPKLLDASNLESKRVKIASCMATFSMQPRGYLSSFTSPYLFDFEKDFSQTSFCK